MTSDKDSIIKALTLWFQPGDVFEIRALGASTGLNRIPHTETGYFDYEHIKEAADAIGKIHSADGIYVTINPVKRDLLARAVYKLLSGKNIPATGDNNILRRHWLLIDCDPVRESGIASNDEEHEYAIGKAKAIREELAKIGWQSPILCDSGNGAHLTYRIDLPTDDGGLIQNVLTALQFFNDDKVKVDLSVFNPARIVRLPGTMNRKGDDADGKVCGRPHRMAKILEASENIVPVTEEQLKIVLGGKKPVQAPVLPDSREQIFYEDIDFNIDEWIAKYAPDAGPAIPYDKNGVPGRKWKFKVCPFNPEHNDNPAVITAFDSGGLQFMCQHNGCRGNDWPKFRVLRQPGCYDHKKKKEYPDVELDKLLHSFKEKSEQKKQEVASDKKHIQNPSGDEAREALSDTIPFPEELYNFPGLVGDIMQTTIKYSSKPNRPLALSGALALMSYLIARKVKTPSGLRSNIYLLALAESGSGKERPRDINQIILEKVNYDAGLIDKASSGEGIEDMLVIKHALFWQCDEFYSTLHDMLKERKDGKDTTMEYLLKLYTNSHKSLRTRAKANKPAIRIPYPSLTMYATTTPASFFEHLNELFLNGGMYARLDLMIAEKTSRGLLPVEPEIPKEIIHTANLWVNFIPPGSGNLDINAMTVPYTADAEQVAKQLFEAQEDESEKARKAEAPEWQRSLWNRACEIALRYALIYACSIAKKPEDTVLTAEAIRWGWKFIWWEIQNKIYLTERHYFRTEFEKISESVIEILRIWHRKNGKDSPMPGWKFNRKTGHIAPNELKAVLESLGKQRRLFVVSAGKGLFYTLTDPDEKKVNESQLLIP